MYRSIFAVALICLFALSTASTTEVDALTRTHKGCPSFCWLRDLKKPENIKFLASKCGKAYWPYTKKCMRKLSNGQMQEGRTCRCEGKETPKPKPTHKPQPPKTNMVSCGDFVMSKGPSKVGEYSMDFKVDVKRARGYFLFNWATYVIKDKFVITQGKDKIFDSNYVMGDGENRVFLNGKGRYVMVSAMSKEGGSIWDFIAGCGKI